MCSLQQYIANSWTGYSLLLLLLLFHDPFFPLLTYLVCKSKDTVLSAGIFQSLYFRREHWINHRPAATPRSRNSTSRY